MEEPFHLTSRFHAKTDLRQMDEFDNEAWTGFGSTDLITGNLEIIEDPSLRELCSYGTKFRENPVLNVHNITEK